jgi:BRCT domain type II-containing protein
MDKFIKRLQTRASRKGISVSKSQVRDIYTQVVVEPESPTDEEMVFVIEKLEMQYQAPSHEQENQLATTAESTPTPQQEPQEMTPAQPTAQPSNSTLATSSRSSLSQASSANLSITQQEIQQAVEQQFGRENVETKTAILNYVAQDTFSTAQELQMALSKLRQMRLDILMKLIADHNSQALSDQDLLKNALASATANANGRQRIFSAHSRISF